jgi:hypothetical protein
VRRLGELSEASGLYVSKSGVPGAEDCELGTGSED